ncbi:MAG: threonine synthase [Planctomycetes bacterium]|nr:threonine synthase [Planctomycetota bacterium]
MSPDCGRQYSLDEVLFACRACGALLDIRYDWARCTLPRGLSAFAPRRETACDAPDARLDASGVWRFRELLPLAPTPDLVTIGEGRTTLQTADELGRCLGMSPGRLFLQYEGFNPSGSFKDNGMAAAFTIARRLGRQRVACASTGNTSASLALFAAHTRCSSGEPMSAIVFVGGGKIAYGKLAQALDYGARTIQVAGDFDACMSLVLRSADRLGLYLMNSVNPFRLEGQKTIIYRVLEGLHWEVPDWIVVPGGNLGNSSAFGKAFMELRELRWIDRVPRLAVINAAGANTLYRLHEEQGLRYNGGRVDQGAVSGFYERMRAEGRTARTVASAIEIAAPVNLPKALRALEVMNGVVRQVEDSAILDAKAMVGRYGYGCEPASAAAVAGLELLLSEGVVGRDERVACVLTGHALKDPNATVEYHFQAAASTTGRRFANPPLPCAADVAAIEAILAACGS